MHVIKDCLCKNGFFFAHERMIAGAQNQKIGNNGTVNGDAGSMTAPEAKSRYICLQSMSINAIHFPWCVKEIHPPENAATFKLQSNATHRI